MAAEGDTAARDLEEAAVMHGEYRSSTNNGTMKKVTFWVCKKKDGVNLWVHKKKDRVFLWVRKKKDGVILWVRELQTEQVTPETLAKENKKTWVVASPILSCNATVITTVNTNNNFFGQSVLILNTLSFILSSILIIVPVALPTLTLVKLKRFVLVFAGFFTLSSFIGYASMKMGPIAGTATAAIFFSGAMVFSVTILFLIPAVFDAPSDSIETPQPLLTSVVPPDPRTETV